MLDGEEVSVIALCDGERYRLLPPARDHKRVGEGDTGPNTGGMGAFAPAGSLDAAALNEVGRRVIAPTLAEMTRRGHPFQGALYAGLMLTREGPQVLEFNCRFGDPETQALMLALDEDLLPLLHACAVGNLETGPLRVASGLSVAVVVAAENYPRAPRLGDEIDGLENLPPEVEAFHAGTAMNGGRLVTAGGRVLTVCARRETAGQARAAVFEALARVRFRGMHFRRDIAAWAG
jgi:phosphoribosylamine--glycine ligase